MKKHYRVWLKHSDPDWIDDGKPVRIYTFWGAMWRVWGLRRHFNHFMIDRVYNQ